jgi:hypothetical protein
MKIAVSSPEELKAALARMHDDQVTDLKENPETGVWETQE